MTNHGMIIYVTAFWETNNGGGTLVRIENCQPQGQRKRSNLEIKFNV